MLGNALLLCCSVAECKTENQGTEVTKISESCLWWNAVKFF